ncbi:MAG: DUF1214 domain-containing protein [Hyphomicrobiales bacterium]|nr:DUF1214 domain-containing protein [Hyphomicrobiales bacterium]
MRFLFHFLLTTTIAAVVGLGLTYFAVEHGRLFGVVHAGEWNAWPRAGSLQADPYTRARLARTREIPIGAGEGLVFVADSDVGGEPLSGNCDYRIVGQTPPARLWTLTVYDDEGRLMETPLGRYGFTSPEVLRRRDGDFEIMLAKRARPGNWVQAGSADHYMLVLRIYDTPLTATSDIENLPLPRVLRAACR